MAIFLSFVLRLARVCGSESLCCFFSFCCVLVLLERPGTNIGVVDVVVGAAARAAACKSVRI